MLVIETPGYSAQQAEILAIKHALQNIPQALVSYLILNILYMSLNIETATIRGYYPIHIVYTFTNLQQVIRHLTVSILHYSYLG